MTKSALGRGLGALLGSGSPAARAASVVPNPSGAAPVANAPAAVAPVFEKGELVRRVALDKIQPCSFQPRKEFSGEALRELADSIREQGILQPLVVRTRGDHYELIAGERRWRAAQLIQLKDVPVIVREADDARTLELALIENLQRENLTPWEEALGYQQLIDQFKLTQEETAVKVGKSRVAVANALRLLRLPEPVQRMLQNSTLSAGHAKVILGLAGAESQQLAAERVVKEGLTVRKTEELVAHWLAAQPKPQEKPAPQAAASRDAHVVDLENRLRERMGTKVALRYRQGKGALEVRFYSDAELERLLQMVGVAID